MGALFSKSRKRKAKQKRLATADSKEKKHISESQTPVESRKESLYRVGSAVDQLNLNESNSGDGDVANFNRARSSTYSNVRDAVMLNLSEAERSKHDQSVPMGVIGLRNLGNTCFINSSLQCLSATIPLTDYFLGYDYRSEINQENFLGTGGKLVTAYAELMKKMWLGTKSTVEPIQFKEQLGIFAPQFNGYHQHDSQELLSFLLDGIHEDLNRVMNRPYVEDRDCDGKKDENDAIDSWKNYLRRNKSLVVDLFQGQLRNTCRYVHNDRHLAKSSMNIVPQYLPCCRCLTCGHQNIRFEPFMYLSLPINKNCRSIEECMNIYLEEEILKGENQWYCGKCKTHVDATKKIDLWILPPILIVHLKRFRYNDNGNVGSKNEASIQYPISQFDLKAKVKSKGSAYPMYDLYAVSNHMGSLGGGHYTALALNRFDDLWYEFNDSSYRCVDETIHRNHRKTAYVLFYNRSEGDANMPLNERAPLIRRQSVSRPDLWPHRQVDDLRKVRGYTRPRASTFDQTDPKSPAPPHHRSRSRQLVDNDDSWLPPGGLGEKKVSEHTRPRASTFDHTEPASPTSSSRRSGSSLFLDKNLREKKQSARQKSSTTSSAQSKEMGRSRSNRSKDDRSTRSTSPSRDRSRDSQSSRNGESARRRKRRNRGKNR